MLIKRSNLGQPRKAFTLFAAVLFFDQALKYLFSYRELIYRNHASLFGLEINSVFAVAALGAFLYFVRKEEPKRRSRLLFPLALILAGITSNSIDRIGSGFVVDYIDFFGMCVFNLSDLAILLGAGLFFWHIIKE